MNQIRVSQISEAAGIHSIFQLAAIADESCRILSSSTAVDITLLVAQVMLSKQEIFYGIFTHCFY